MKVNVGLQSNIGYNMAEVLTLLKNVHDLSHFFFFWSNNLRKCMWFRLCRPSIM